MVGKDAGIIKEGILSFLREKGPSFPVNIAKCVGLDTLFTSAFLSELISEKLVLSSYMRVGTSSVYFLPGQEKDLEKFSEYIKGKEREALNLLKEKKFLVDLEQEPAIKVALRGIKDFAKAFEMNEKVIWRYFTEKEENYKKEEIKVLEEPIKIEKGITQVHEKKELKKIKSRASEKGIQKKKTPTKINKLKKTNKKTDELFFNKIKTYLTEKNFEILDIISFNKKDLILKVKYEGEEKLVISYNKKRITEKDILNASKRAELIGLKYIVISLGETPKKISSWIEALKTLDSIEKTE
ncbi:MAG: hypothetical protein NUV46_02295 [Nanoarchaeota archaeon]|nr:hypothetical protein [Nanoarchaeota archaeon]